MQPKRDRLSLATSELCHSLFLRLPQQQNNHRALCPVAAQPTVLLLLFFLQVKAPV